MGKRVDLDCFDLPHGLWASMTPGDFTRFIEANGWLNRDQRRLVWRLMGHQGPTPSVIVVSFDVARVVTLWPVGGPPVAPADVPVQLRAALLQQ